MIRQLLPINQTNKFTGFDKVSQQLILEIFIIHILVKICNLLQIGKLSKTMVSTCMHEPTSQNGVEIQSYEIKSQENCTFSPFSLDLYLALKTMCTGWLRNITVSNYGYMMVR